MGGLGLIRNELPTEGSKDIGNTIPTDYRSAGEVVVSFLRRAALINGPIMAGFREVSGPDCDKARSESYYPISERDYDTPPLSGRGIFSYGQPFCEKYHRRTPPSNGASYACGFSYVSDKYPGYLVLDRPNRTQSN